MAKTKSGRTKGNVENSVTLSLSMGAPYACVMTGIFFAAVIFFGYWLFGWNNSITQKVLIDGMDMTRLTWVNVLIDPVAQGAAMLYNQNLFFSTVGVFALVVFTFFLIVALASKR